VAGKGVYFELQGFLGFKAALEKAADEVKQRVSVAMEATADAVRDGARARVSVDEGDLRRSIITTPRRGSLDLTWTVGISDDVFASRGGDRVHQRPFIYGAILERGDRTHAGKPFMRPAADVELPRFESRIRLTGLVA
jgi:hypothetical protein